MRDPEHSKDCPHCGEPCDRDSADVGVGIIYGPWGCMCGWSEDPRYDQISGTGGWQADGSYADTTGGVWPAGSDVVKLMRAAEAHEKEIRDGA